MGLGPHPVGRARRRCGGTTTAAPPPLRGRVGVRGTAQRPKKATPTPGGDEIPPYMSGVGPPAMRPRNPPPGGDEKRPRQRGVGNAQRLYMSGVGAPAVRPRNPLSVSPPRGELYGPALCP
eukprot:gene17062-biopygen15875